MFSVLWNLFRVFAAVSLALVFAVPSTLLAQEHLVSPSELQKEVVAFSESRQRNGEKVAEFLTSPAANEALGAANLDPQQVKTAVSTLSDEELAQLAMRADKAQADFVAGTLSNRDLLLIIVGIAALVLIIVAV